MNFYQKLIPLCACAMLATPAFGAVINLSPTGLASPVLTIDFSEFSVPETNPITTEFSSLGVSFSPNLFYRTNDNPAWANILGANLRSGEPNVSNFSLDFEVPLTSAAFAAIAQPPTPTTFTALLDGVEVESFNTNVTIDNRDNFFGFEGIVFDEINVVYTADTRMRIDNLQLGPAIPEPGTVTISLLGLLGLCCRRRRRVALA
jgi:hypothetical protein